MKGTQIYYVDKKLYEAVGVLEIPEDADNSLPSQVIVFVGVR